VRTRSGPPGSRPGRLRAAVVAGLLTVPTGGCAAPSPAGDVAPAGASTTVTTAPATSVPPGAGVAGSLAPGPHELDVAGQPAVVVVPERSNGRLVVYLHGYDADSAVLTADAGFGALVGGLVEAGYTVAASDAGGDAWGGAGSVDAHAALTATVGDLTGADEVFLVAESMGGLAGAQLVDDGRIEGLRGYVGIYPVCDLSSVYVDYRPSVDAAHGPGVEQALAALSPVGLRAAVPVLLYASEGDTRVPKDRNADVCAAQVRAEGGTVEVVQTVGDHGDPSNFDLEGMLDFFTATAG
jgi:hypothetical protein